MLDGRDRKVARARSQGTVAVSSGFPMGLSPAPIITTFPPAPLRSRTVGFPESGSDLGATPRSSSWIARSSSADPHTPRLHPVYFQGRPLVHRPYVLLVRLHPGTTKCPEPLRVLEALPLTPWLPSPRRQALPRRLRSNELMRQSYGLPPPMVTASVSRSSPVAVSPCWP